MKREQITLFDATEGGFQAQKVSSKENVPMSDKRLQIVFQGITRIVVIVMSFWLAGKVLPDADTYKAVFLSLCGIGITAICLYYASQNKNN